MEVHRSSSVRHTIQYAYRDTFILAKASHVMQFVAHVLTFIQNKIYAETIVSGRRRPASANKSQSVVLV